VTEEPEPNVETYDIDSSMEQCRERLDEYISGPHALRCIGTWRGCTKEAVVYLERCRRTHRTGHNEYKAVPLDTAT
jgi:hypothetical protein